MKDCVTLSPVHVENTPNCPARGQPMVGSNGVNPDCPPNRPKNLLTSAGVRGCSCICMAECMMAGGM